MARDIFAGGYDVTPNGAFGHVRTPGHGQCSHGYPCTHPGVDKRPHSLTDFVVAPEACIVRRVAHDNATAPLTGYGPGAVLVESDTWTRATQVWHVLAHLDPDTWQGVRPRAGRRYAEGEPIARIFVGVAPHCHHEVRRGLMLPPGGTERMRYVIDPARWLQWHQLGAAGAVALAGALAGRAFS